MATRKNTSNSNSNSTANDPAALLLAALEAVAATQQTNSGRRTSQSKPEALSQPLTARDRYAIDRAGWTGCKLSSSKPSEPKPTAERKSGPAFKASTFRDLSPERQASVQFWAGLCSTLARSAGRIWLPEAAAVAVQLGVNFDGPAQLAARLAALTGCPVTRPTTDAGWMVCELPGEMPGADAWVGIWQANLAAFKAAAIAEGFKD